MHIIETIYIDGNFLTPHGKEYFDLYNPAEETSIGRVRLGDVEDTRLAIAAAKRAFPAFSKTSKEERIAILQRLHAAVNARSEALTEATVEEYGAPVARASWGAGYAAECFLNAAKTLEQYEFERTIGSAKVVLEPLGVVGLITPWNNNYGFICNKLSMAIAAGCTAVIKPSEMSALQTQILTECLHEAGVPAGVFNIVNGRGDVVGAELSVNPDIAKISFTGSTAVGKSILRTGAETMKRVTLELGGKSPTVVLDDADFATAIPQVIAAGFGNSGQACVNGTRILVPEARLADFIAQLKSAVLRLKVGDPRDLDTLIGPMVSKKQYERVQRYIALGSEEGATVITGGEGRPAGMESGYFVRPTVFSGVTNNMTIAREEIFGPVVAVISYRTEDEAIEIANDTIYGLQAYVMSENPDRARAVASRIVAGRVHINGVHTETQAPFGGFKQSGIGREFGVFGLEAYLEPKTILGV
ncbi:aldehyde dehydrogenase family protein [Rhizobium tubonense]|uniref:aldehyde dehydrogenase (NAD(+)) n=1 Tax=Rhizobium tubonense TaxID=484088 RepID=A0A2W4CCA3_9HYPH|nr:aldehyde dehydrogenase family protein [Rhizobium tubonense]PZM10897.1 aldehyde dehydrogenase family protein [Rhizobium tubonense]